MVRLKGISVVDVTTHLLCDLAFRTIQTNSRRGTEDVEFINGELEGAGMEIGRIVQADFMDDVRRLDGSILRPDKNSL
jgi:hypothetical protein